MVLSGNMASTKRRSCEKGGAAPPTRRITQGAKGWGKRNQPMATMPCGSNVMRHSKVTSVSGKSSASLSWQPSWQSWLCEGIKQGSCCCFSSSFSSSTPQTPVPYSLFENQQLRTSAATLDTTRTPLHHLSRIEFAKMVAPAIVMGLRGVQVVFSIIVLGLTAYRM